VLLQARPVQLTQADLREPADDPRELAALRTNIEQLHEEAAELYSHVSAVNASNQELAKNIERLSAEHEQVSAEHEELSAEHKRLQAELATISDSRSWRYTRPFRSARAVLRSAKS
jgi:chromosome segregation ATPase